MTTLDTHYIQHYTPLIQDFARGVEALPHPDIDEMPEPFFPLFGKHYGASALKLVVIGQDTAWWGDLRHFLSAEKANPGSKLHEGLNAFRDHKFTSWAGPRQSFWGFAMMFLATLHGKADWGAMKQGKMAEILDSFAWGNGNAVELYTSSAAKLGVPVDYWNAVRRAGERFNRFRHIQETLCPNVAVVMNRGIHLPTYFDGYRLDKVYMDGRLTHYRLPEVGVDVFLVPHPRSMNFHEGTDYFRDKLKELFVRLGLTAVFPQFLAGQEEGKKAMDYLNDKAPRAGGGTSKFECVAWVADELKKRDTFMSVPALCTLLNEHGYRTNYDEEFTGGRGSYRLVSGTYHRLDEAGQPDRARNVALAFRRPNFEYAYNTE